LCTIYCIRFDAKFCASELKTKAFRWCSLVAKIGRHWQQPTLTTYKGVQAIEGALAQIILRKFLRVDRPVVAHANEHHRKFQMVGFRFSFLGNREEKKKGASETAPAHPGFINFDFCSVRFYRLNASNPP
jgi:hypothetical protein